MGVAFAAILASCSTAAALCLMYCLPFPGPLFLFPVCLSLFQFSVTPFLRAIGFYRYHSPMLKSTLRTTSTWEIHGGTSLDYLLFLRRGEPVESARRRLLVSYLQGLRDIALLVEAGEISRDVTITGTSYFFNDRSARRLGFRIETAGLRLRIVLVIYALDLFVLYSVVRGRLAFPNILSTRRAVISAGELARNRGVIEAIVARLERVSAPKVIAATRRVSIPSSRPGSPGCRGAEEIPAA